MPFYVYFSNSILWLMRIFGFFITLVQFFGSNLANVNSSVHCSIAPPIHSSLPGMISTVTKGRDKTFLNIFLPTKDATSEVNLFPVRSTYKYIGKRFKTQR